jgi:DNA-directed RNA polymerase specialized sigma subunit
MTETLTPRETATATAAAAADPFGPFGPAGPAPGVDTDALIIEHEQMARRIASAFRARRRYPLEREEFEAQALLVLAEVAREYPTANTVLPFEAYAARRITWRLEDFVQSWYRIDRTDYNAKVERPRTITSLSPALDGTRRSGPDDRAARDPAVGLYVQDVRAAMAAVLTDRQRDVMRLHYDESMTLASVAKTLGMTHLRARQVHSEALARVRTRLNGRRVAAA